MTDDETIGTFLSGLSRLTVDDAGLTGATDPADAATMWSLAKRLHARLRDDTPHDLALHRLATLTAALIAGHQLGIETENLGRDWLIARSELLQLQIPTV